jgi:hypothetical protein
MPNGECHVGAANRAEIEALKREQKTQNESIKDISVKLDRINWWLVALLGGMVVSLGLQIAGRMGG